MAFKILTDSCCNLPEYMIDEFGLEVFPLTFMVDGREHQSYLKGEVTDLSKFYDMMREGKVITTSLPNLDSARKLMAAQLEEGHDVLYLGFSSGLSGTFDAIRLLMDELASTPSTRWPHRAARGCSCGTPASWRAQGRRSRRCATGSRRTSCTWRTGSPSTT